MTTELLPISVVMVTFQTGKVLAEAIAGVLANPIAELIVVNNGNPEIAFAPVRSTLAEDKRCRLIEGQGNVGYARACNLGASHAKQANLLLLNPDAVLQADTLIKLYHSHLSLPQPALSGVWVTDEDGNVQRGTLRNELSPLSLLVEAGKLNQRWAIFDRWALNRLHDKYNETAVRVPALSGACLLLSKSLFTAVQGFDEGYFLHFEDLDLLKRLNCDKYLHPSVRVVHHKSSSNVASETLNSHKYYSFCRYFRHHYPLFWYSPLGVAVKLIMKWRHQQIFST